MPSPCLPMAKALEIAREAAHAGDVPVGAVIMRGGKVLAIASNRVERDQDPTAHAELLAIRKAAQALGDARLEDCDLYVTLEPCAMCAQAISLARLRRLYYGAYDPKGGGVDHGAKVFSHRTCNHIPEVYGGIQENECAQILREFFKGRRG
jgi:tRNA(adenine34) deaminase